MFRRFSAAVAQVESSYGRFPVAQPHSSRCPATRFAFIISSKQLLEIRARRNPKLPEDMTPREKLDVRFLFALLTGPSTGDFSTGWNFLRTLDQGLERNVSLSCTFLSSRKANYSRPRLAGFVSFLMFRLERLSTLAIQSCTWKKLGSYLLQRC